MIIKLFGREIIRIEKKTESKMDKNITVINDKEKEIMTNAPIITSVFYGGFIPVKPRDKNKPVNIVRD